MAENMAFVDAHASDWHFDHLNGQPFDWDTGLVADDQLDLNEADLYASFFESGAFWGQGVQDESNGKMPANFPQGSSMEAPPVVTGKQEWHDPETNAIPEFNASQLNDSVPPALADFLRTTPRQTTERALYMNAPNQVSPSPMEAALPPSPSSFLPNLPLPQPPVLDHCSSPETSFNSDSGDSSDELDLQPFPFYLAPDPFQSYGIQSFHGLTDSLKPPAWNTEQQKPNPNTHGLTPLEMPDGTTRLTANWLPVDPEGGCTIGGDTMNPPEETSPFSLGPLQQDNGVFLHGNGTLSRFGV